MYYISVNSLGSFLTDWVNDTLFGDIITNAATAALESIAAAEWLISLVVDGTGCGVSAVMAARTIENEANCRMTIMLSAFIPCTAKSRSSSA